MPPATHPTRDRGRERDRSVLYCIPISALYLDAKANSNLQEKETVSYSPPFFQVLTSTPSPIAVDEEAPPCPPLPPHHLYMNTRVFT